MKDNSPIGQTIQNLKLHYYCNIALAVVLFALTAAQLIPGTSNSVALGVVAERYALMLTIIAIPASLKYFAYRLQKVIRPLEIEAAVEIYRKAFLVRLYSISFVTLANIVLFAISRNTNYFWLTVVLLIVYLFCKPSLVELESLTETPLPVEEAIDPNTSDADNE